MKWSIDEALLAMNYRKDNYDTWTKEIGHYYLIYDGFWFWERYDNGKTFYSKKAEIFDHSLCYLSQIKKFEEEFLINNFLCCSVIHTE